MVMDTVVKCISSVGFGDEENPLIPKTLENMKSIVSVRGFSRR